MAPRIILCLCYILVAIWMQRTECGLISQSSITKCEWGNSQEPTTGKEEATCKKKFVISMTLKSGQGEVEALYANVRQAYVEGASGMSTLKKPFRIEISKTQTIASYRAYYRGSVNGGPEEHVIYYHNPRSCKDSWKAEKLSCGKQKAVGSNEYAWDSQGFCCRCNYETRDLRRPNATCERRIFDGNYHGYYLWYGKKKKFGSSAHCMMQNPIWFDVFSLDQPMMQYNITIKLLQFNGFTVDPTTEVESANWTTLSTFYLNPSRTVSRSKDGRVIAELQGDLVGARGPLDLTTKMLLVPSINVVGKKGKKPLRQNRDPKFWLLADENMVDLSGLQCNKVGTSYSGFRRQLGRCHQDYKSCFTNQPLDLLRHDMKLLKKKKKGSYMLTNFGRVHPSTKNNDHSFIVRLIHEDLHNSFVTFRIDASDIQFVYNVGKGRIVDARSSDFKALTEVGTMYVEVENTGEIVAEFTVVLSECFGRKNLPGKEITLEPGRIGNVTFFLQSYKMFGEESICEVQLFDTDFNLLGTAKVDVKVQSNCFCYGACGCSCLDDGTTTMMECPTPPPIIIEEKGVFLRVFFLVLEIIGPQGIIGFFAVILLFFGCLKLCFGGILICRKSKAQEHWDNMKEKGAPMKKGPELVKCAGECRGAKAAKARYKRKVEKIKRMGKTVRDLDDWRNTSFICTCHEELADIRFLHVIKALCFFYYILFVPFIWLGKKLWWGIFKDTATKKAAAKKAVLKKAKKQGKLEEYGIIDLQTELNKMKEESQAIAKEEKKLADSKPPEDGGKLMTLDQTKPTALEGVTAIESGSKPDEKKKKEKQKKEKGAKKSTGDVVDSKGALDDKHAKTVKGPNGKIKDFSADGKPLTKGKGGTEVGKGKDPIHGFKDETQRDKKQHTAERKAERPPKDKQHYPKSSSAKPRKQKSSKLMKEHKPQSSSKPHKAHSQSAHTSKGSKSLSPEKHSSTSVASKKEGSKHSIASKHSSHSIGKTSTTSVSAPKKDSLERLYSKSSSLEDDKSHHKVSKEESKSSGVSKISSHSSQKLTSKSSSHSSKHSSHSSHTSKSSSHSSKDSSHSSKSTSGSSSSHSEHTLKGSSSEKHTSLSSVLPIPSDISGSSIISKLSFASCISSSASANSIVPSLSHSSSSVPDTSSHSSPTIKTSQSSLSSHGSISSSAHSEETNTHSSSSHSDEGNGESSSDHEDTTDHSHSESDHTEYESTSDAESSSSEEHSSEEEDSTSSSSEEESDSDTTSSESDESSHHNSTSSVDSHSSSHAHSESGSPHSDDS